jgi:thiol-disulfide isomerase/thioredoxin
MNMLFPSLAALLILQSAVLGAPPNVGESFPDFARFGLEGALPDLKGKVALVDFWASWCAPCKRSFPLMREINEKFASRGFLVVAISVDEKQADMQAFLKKNPIPFTVLHDPKGRLAEAVGLEKMPTSFILGADGKVIAVHSGFEGEATRKAYLAEVEAALKAAGK